MTGRSNPLHDTFVSFLLDADRSDELAASAAVFAHPMLISAWGAVQGR